MSKTWPIYFFTSLELFRYQSLSIFSDIISDKMSLVVVRITLSFPSFSSFFPLCKWKSFKSLEALLFNLTTFGEFPSCWQNMMYPLKHSFLFPLQWVGSQASDLVTRSLSSMILRQSDTVKLSHTLF